MPAFLRGPDLHLSGLDAFEGVYAIFKAIETSVQVPGANNGCRHSDSDRTRYNQQNYIIHATTTACGVSTAGILPLVAVRVKDKMLQYG